MARITAKLREWAQMERDGNPHMKRWEGSLWDAHFSLASVRGAKKEIRLQLAGLPGEYEDGPVIEGSFHDLTTFSMDVGEGVEPYTFTIPPGLTLTLNTSLPWSEIASGPGLDVIYETLLHEMTHATEGVFGTFRRVYFNDLSEVRAFMVMVLEQVRVPLRSLMATRMGRSLGAGGALMHVLEMAPVSWTWSHLQPYLTPRNRNLILKGLVTALEDEGIITVR
jgi:hypothetical protein